LKKELRLNAVVFHNANYSTSPVSHGTGDQVGLQVEAPNGRMRCVKVWPFERNKNLGQISLWTLAPFVIQPPGVGAGYCQFQLLRTPGGGNHI
jgi:hypothetical protein